MAIQFMRAGQQGYLFHDTLTGLKFGIDLFLSELPGRAVPNVLDIPDLADVSLLFGSHDHDDHIDRRMWTKAAKTHPHLKFVVSLYFKDTLPGELGIAPERFIFADEGHPADFGGLHIEAIPAAHEFIDEDERGLHPYLVYILTLDGVKICHMGDTCVYEGMYGKLRAKGPFDLLLPPINGRDAVRLASNCIGNMTFQEAADLAGALKPGLAVPGHYDMFPHNSEDPQKFIDYVRVKYPEQKVQLCPPGEWFVLK